jgi:hypothetical protein
MGKQGEYQFKKSGYSMPISVILSIGHEGLSQDRTIKPPDRDRLTSGIKPVPADNRNMCLNNFNASAGMAG